MRVGTCRRELHHVSLIVTARNARRFSSLNLALTSWSEHDCATDQFGLCSVPGQVGENCTVAADCTDVIIHSACLDATCTCLGDTVPSPDKHACRLPVVGDPCTTPEVCKYIRPHSRCRAGSCDCEPGLHTPRDPYYCVRRKLGDPCRWDEDCFAAVKNSRCTLQACDCDAGFRRHPNRTVCVWAKDPENIAAVTLSVFVICLLCFVLIATVPVLVYYFVLKPREKLPEVLRQTR